MRSVFRILGGLVAAYVLLLGSAFAFQDRLVYFPDRTPASVPEGLPAEVVTLNTKDNETIVAWFLEAAPNCPTLLKFHGNAGHIGKESWVFHRLHAAGVGMLAVSWRGYAGSTGKPSQAGLFADSDAAYAYLRARDVSPDQIVISGFSLGTGPATRLAALQDAAALLLEAPYFSALKLAEDKAPFLPVSLVFRHPYRSDKFIPTVDEPILIVHGGSDTIIPAEHSEALVALAQSPATRIVLPRSSHNSLVSDGMYESAVWPFLSSLFPDCAFGANHEDISL
ncbi:MAG: alpha/beta hydrolase [Pseudomonadota bacterium]